ncbi:54S ribosomal protein L2 mitochondrial [Pleodorina starrii]|uniref:54S ribosomal protein L2 mitochondrial n=1 Tax=Pleodorina starrii TaxID=330485 RepID=A0A9W6BJC9_9CHLO|nr:54S ribosomal protein L2 mitochondrial [Pleodorina starrii]GLC53209.1 54S ribosomal protein L2 mitochondrial [Pleodorina starrii]GLC68664.1 54S ribosomal protein L2 mitochondrial [Pleodorina starrii]
MLRRLAQSCANLLTKQTCSILELAQPSTSGSLLASGHEALQSGGGFLLQLVRSKYTYKFKKAAPLPGLIYWKPTTPGLRHKITIDYESLGVYTGPPTAALSRRVGKTGGRNDTGRITTRHRGGGPPKVLREVEFDRRPLDGLAGVVQRVELDPNRSGFLVLVKYSPEGELPFLRYHLAPAELKPGDVMMSGSGAPVRAGNELPLREIPIGVPIHGLELLPGRGPVAARAACTSAVIQSKQEHHAVVKLPSTEIRLIPLDCRATVGQVSNHLQNLVNLGKAGERRKRGWRPSVRGIAMNPVDHPHGGRTNGGRPSCTPWGVYTKGTRTRRRNKGTNRFILVRKGGQPIEKFVQARKWRARAKLEKRMASGGGGGGKAAGAGAKR